MDNYVWLYMEINFYGAADEAGPVNNEIIYGTAEKAARATIEKIEKYLNDGFVIEKDIDAPNLDNLMYLLNRNDSYCIEMYDQFPENYQCFFDICLTKMPIN